MKKIILFILICALTICGATIFVSATDTAYESEAISGGEESGIESASETVARFEESGTDIAGEVIDAIQNTGSKSEAIISLAEKLGITLEEAEQIINTVIEVGDEYVGDSAWWVSFKNNVQSDIQFWTVAIVLMAAVLAIIGGVFVLLAKTNPTMKKAMWGMTEVLNIVVEIKNEIVQTLRDLRDIVARAAEKQAEYEKLVTEKEDTIILLKEQIKDNEERFIEELNNIYEAVKYMLRMQKLICDRTTMPLADKATIDLFYAKGIDKIDKNLSAEDVAQIEKNMAALNSVNAVGDNRD